MNITKSLIISLSLSSLISCTGTPATSSSSESQTLESSSPSSTPPASSSTSSISPVSSSSVSSSSAATVANFEQACNELLDNPAVNWDESALQNDQDIVRCLAESLGKPIGYGENATGGYSAQGGSQLVVIKAGTHVLPEQQLLDAISSSDYNWIVFDKDDFASGRDISMYRLHCEDASVLSALDNASTQECLNHEQWCAGHGVSDNACLDTFFNQKLENSSLPIRNVMITSNTTIDGRGANASILFNGFKIGADSSGASTHQANNVILTHLDFKGAGHTEDHGLDPDMIRATGESYDIWIHKNTFSNTGDSAFDVKVGAYNITMSFNRLEDVLRAALHGSSDSREINAQIRSTMHNNAFLTSDEFYNGSHDGGNTARRVPLLRRGKAHLINNVFMNYRKNFASVRVGGTLLIEHNVFLGGASIQNEKSGEAGYTEWLSYLTREKFDGGFFSSNDTLVRFANNDCVIDNTYSGQMADYIGNPADDLSKDYSARSKDAINTHITAANQDLVDYVLATAGKHGAVPFNSPKTLGHQAILNTPRARCL